MARVSAKDNDIAVEIWRGIEVKIRDGGAQCLGVAAPPEIKILYFSVPGNGIRVARFFFTAN